MATRLFIVGGFGPGHAYLFPVMRGTNEAALNGGTTYGWRTTWLSPSRGIGANSFSVSTVNGPTDGIELFYGGANLEFLSPPLAADATISGTITLNLWARENDAAANAAANAVLDRVDSQMGVVSTIAQTARTTELGIGTYALENFSVSPTSTTLQKGERIRLRVYIDDAATSMVAGYIAYALINSPIADVDGDSWVEFTETLTFMIDDPVGSTLYLTDTAGPDVGAATEREMWTTRGSGVQTDVVDTAAGFTSPVQWTDTAGGTVVEWYSPTLAAFTLAGVAKVNLRALESNALAVAGIRAELATCDGDGTNVTVWASAVRGRSDTVGAGALSTTEADCVVWLAADDLAVTSGQRLRLRVFVDDTSVPMVTGYTATLYYAGTTAGASGDSYITLSQFIAGEQTVYPDADTTTTGWTSTPLWSRVDDVPTAPDATVITATAS